MTTYTVNATKPAKMGPAGDRISGVGTVILDVLRGTTVVTTGPATGDVYQMVKLPAGAIITGGRLRTSRVSSGTSAASTTMALSIGLTGAFKDLDGTSYGATTASLALANTWLMEYEVASLGGVKMESGFHQPLGGLLLTLGQLRLTEEQWAFIKFQASAASFISGSQMTLEVDYYMGSYT